MKSNVIGLENGGHFNIYERYPDEEFRTLVYFLAKETGMYAVPCVSFIPGGYENAKLDLVSLPD